MPPTTIAKKVKMPTVEADLRHLVEDHGVHRPRWICLHDTESHDLAGLGDVRGIAEFFKRQGRGYGSHLVIDKEGNTGRLVDDLRIGWHVGGHNTATLGIEQIGFARFTPSIWRLRPKQLEEVAKWLAYWNKAYGIPLVHSRRSGRDLTEGVFTHADWSKVPGSPSDHTDPGWAYPLERVLKRARALRAAGW